MSLDQDPALAIMAAVLLILLLLTAWSWLRVAGHPEQRESAAYVTAATLGYGGLVLFYLLITRS